MQAQKPHFELKKDLNDGAKFVPIDSILTDAARERSHDLQAREWEMIHAELMRRIAA